MEKIEINRIQSSDFADLTSMVGELLNGIPVLTGMNNL